MSGKKVLFIISGMGLGNSTRCDAVMHWLSQKEVGIDVLTAENGLFYFSNSPYVTALHRALPLSYAKNSAGDLSPFKTFFSFPNALGRIWKNHQQLEKLINQNQYQLIVTDSDYTVGFKFRFKRPPIIAINNSSEIMSEVAKDWTLPLHLVPQFGFEAFDLLYHRVVPDYLLVPGITSTGTSRVKNSFFLPPLVRPGLTPASRSGSVRNVLIMLSGSAFQTNAAFIQKISGSVDGINFHLVGSSGAEASPGCRNYGKLKDNRELLNIADVVVSNGGASSLGEAVALKKPVVAIPLKNHAEQYLNSLQIQKKGLGLMADESNAHEKLSEVLNNYDSFCSRLRKENILLDGARKAADIIFSILQGADPEI